MLHFFFFLFFLVYLVENSDQVHLHKYILFLI